MSTPSVRKYSNRRRKVKQTHRHYKKILRMLARGLQEIEEVLKCE